MTDRADGRQRQAGSGEAPPADAPDTFLSAARAPTGRDDPQERIARITMLLEELRLNTGDLIELSEQARNRARGPRDETRRTCQQARTARRRARSTRVGRKR